MQKKLNILALTAGASLVAVSSHAQVIASENFSGYTSGVQLLGDGSAGGGWANSWADKNSLDRVQSGSLNYTDSSGNKLVTSGNSVQANGAVNPATASSEPQRTLTSTGMGVLALANTADPDTVWMSYLWQGGNTASSGSDFRQATLMFLKGASTSSATATGTEYMDIGMPNISAANVGTVSPNISLWSNSGNAGQTLSSLAPLQSTVAANNGLTDFILIEMTGTAAAWGTAGNSETMNVWIDPTLTGDVPVGSPDITYSGQDLSVINGIRLQGGGYNSTYGTLPGEQTISDIILGDTPNDVEPVPEPASMALGALGGLSLLVMRRKR